MRLVSKKSGLFRRKRGGEMPSNMRSANSKNVLPTRCVNNKNVPLGKKLCATSSSVIIERSKLGEIRTSVRGRSHQLVGAVISMAQPTINVSVYEKPHVSRNVLGKPSGEKPVSVPKANNSNAHLT